MSKAPIDQLRDRELPRMVRWYDPGLLARVGVRTIVSSVFGQYADQRLIQAVSDTTDDTALVGRYNYSDPTALERRDRIYVDPKSQSFWVDYVADVGDGFEPTYTMAYLMAQPELQLKGVAEPLRHGSILVMGGDQCYPQATRQEYESRLQRPYQWAFDVPVPERKLFAIPGNHDWYDGLIAFDGLFCTARDKLSEGYGTPIGGWQCMQHRSYWALRLPHKWWIWGVDIQFGSSLDAAQINYFRTVAKKNDIGPDDKIVICMAEPSWVISELLGEDPNDNFGQITSIARAGNSKICAVIAGDWHHYAHYHAPELGTHFITSGGGGSFLHPTHVLKDSIKVRWPQDRASPGEQVDITGKGTGAGWRTDDVDIRLGDGRGDGAAGRLGNSAREALEGVTRGRVGRIGRRSEPAEPKVYPDKTTSLRLSFGNLLFPFLNYPFAVGIGVAYWLVTWQFHETTKRYGISKGRIDQVSLFDNSIPELMARMPIYVLNATASIGFTVMLAMLFWVLVSYVQAAEQPRWWRIMVKSTVGGVHFLAHLAVMLLLFLTFHATNNAIAPWFERQFESAVEAKETVDGWIPKVIVEETLEPLSTRNFESRQRPELQQQSPGAALPREMPPDIYGPPRPERSVDDRAVREVVGLLYPFQMILIGGFFGGLVWGFYWVISGLVGRMHTEDAFGALRIQGYKNFLRMRFEPDRLTIYPVGVDRIPRAHEWRARNPGEVLPGNPALVPNRPIDAHLIEPPIVIDVDNVKPAPAPSPSHPVAETVG
jgi:hypothetical protein